MEKPKCKLCGERHYGICATSPETITPNNLQEIQKKPAKRGTFDRNAYQRELMRKRRALAKLAKGNDE